MNYATFFGCYVYNLGHKTKVVLNPILMQLSDFVHNINKRPFYLFLFIYSLSRKRLRSTLLSLQKCSSYVDLPKLSW